MPVETQSTLEGECRRIASEIHAASDRIAAEFGPSESAFLEIGGDLQSLCMVAESLTAATAEAAEKARSSLSENAVPQIGRVSRELFAELEEDSVRVEESLRSLAGIASALGQLRGATEFLRSVAKRLNTLRIYVEIESSRSDNAMAAFASFGDDMTKLGELVLQTCEALTADEQAAREELTRSQVEILRDLGHTRKLSSTAEDTLRKAQESVQAFLAQMGDTLATASGHSAAIGEAVDEMVRSLQFHDIVRQQLEHVVEALNEAARALDCFALDTEPDVNRAFALLTLQEQHIRDAVESVSMARATVDRGFERSFGEVAALVRDLPTAEGDATERFGRRPLEELMVNTRGLLDLHRRALNLEERTAQSAAAMARASESLSQHVEGVRRISDDMELRALNAAVKSARLGREGLTLKVPAAEVTNLSAGSAGFVASTIETLDRITEASTSMAVGSAGGVADRDDRSRDIEELLASVRAAYDDLGAACTAISVRAAELQTRIAERKGATEFLGPYSERLRCDADVLGKLRNEIAPYATDLQVGLRAERARLSDRYTMESERDVFHRLASADEPPEVDDLAVEQGGCILF